MGTFPHPTLLDVSVADCIADGGAKPSALFAGFICLYRASCVVSLTATCENGHIPRFADCGSCRLWPCLEKLPGSLQKHRRVLGFSQVNCCESHQPCRSSGPRHGIRGDATEGWKNKEVLVLVLVAGSIGEPAGTTTSRMPNCAFGKRSEGRALFLTAPVSAVCFYSLLIGQC
jgi:hypothetical protein